MNADEGNKWLLAEMKKAVMGENFGKFCSLSEAQILEDAAVSFIAEILPVPGDASHAINDAASTANKGAGGNMQQRFAYYLMRRGLTILQGRKSQ